MNNIDLASIDLEQVELKGLSGLSRDLIEMFYLRDGESISQGLARPALAFADDAQHAQDILNDVRRGWAMYSSPIFSNAPAPGETPKSMPISCFLSYVPDSREGLVHHQEELAWLSMLGGGVGGHWDDIRAVSDKSVGPLPHIKIADSAVEGFRQGRTRKGSYAAYLSINHPDIVEFISMRSPTGGDINRKCFNAHHAVNVTNAFMDAAFAGEQWDLKCPKTGDVKDTVDARELWQSILEMRSKTGEPYINFIDTANLSLPQSQKDLGLEIHGSNLCNEIHLPTNEDRTAVCCLSSVNLEKHNEWCTDTDFIGRWVRFLDNILEFFIQNAPDRMSKAVFSARNERAIGLGAMGFHHMLQQRMIPWESPMAVSLNKMIFRRIETDALKESKKLAKERGEAPDMAGTGLRNSHLLAIAPNANSGLILGTSPSIEPLRSNAFSQRTRAGTHLIKNPYLDQVFREVYRYRVNDLKSFPNEDEWIEKQWQDVVLNQGSVQHLDYLDDWTKDVFKNAFEIDQRWVIQHAADRQPFVCQGQSVNLYFPPQADQYYVNVVHLKAWKDGLKGVYYYRTKSHAQGDTVSQKIERMALKDYKDEEECLSCQG
jgi:ribonucleoside-diphosphate reductase alpha chain